MVLVVGAIVACEVEGGGVGWQGCADDVGGEEFSCSAGGHDAEAREGTDDGSAGYGQWADEGAVFTCFDVVATVDGGAWGAFEVACKSGDHDGHGTKGEFRVVGFVGDGVGWFDWFAVVVP